MSELWLFHYFRFFLKSLSTDFSYFLYTLRELLGDTVLKMVASWAVYLAQPLAQEGELTDAR